MKKKYFKNLHSLRFFLAFFVIIHHLELFLIDNKLLKNYSSSFTQGSGASAVTFFFVLSGFLITYILLQEKNNDNSISISRFYLKRVVRIWPLYYIILIIGFFIAPAIGISYSNTSLLLKKDYLNSLAEYFFFIPNYTLSKFIYVPFATHLWSIGVEEQFYLFWPLLIKFSNNIKKSVFFIILITIFLKSYFYIFNISFGYNTAFQFWFREFLRLTRFECMAIGSVGAIILVKNELIFKRYLLNPITQIVTYFIIIILLFYNINIPIIHNYVYSFLFIVAILNLSSDNKSIIKLEFQPFIYLGRVSYGLYMYHPICIGLSHVFLKQYFKINNNENYVFTLFSLSFFLTLLASIFSFNFIEKKIMRYANH